MFANRFKRLKFIQSKSTRLTYKCTVKIRVKAILNCPIYNFKGLFIGMRHPTYVRCAKKLKGTIIKGPPEYVGKRSLSIISYRRIRNIKKNDEIEIDISLKDKLMAVRS